MKIQEYGPNASIQRGVRGWLFRGAILWLLLVVPLLLLTVLPQPVLAASIGTYDQCANDDGDGYTPPPNDGCDWINGNLQQNNSTYFEGDATVQRLWLTDFVPGSSHTVTFQYATTKGAKHAYDFLTTWDWSESWITAADRCQDITGCTGETDTTFPIPVDPNAGGFDTGTRNFVMRGGTITAATTPTIVSGSYAGDSETAITITFTVDNSGTMCTTQGQTTTCAIALWFGAHVAAQANWGTGNGAGSISGSPYHVSLDKIDGGAIGERDNQMQANVVTEIPNGTITIVKDAQPNSVEDFNFNLNSTNPPINQNFSLDDDGDGTLPNSQSFSVPPGTYTATELLPLPTNWTLVNISCVDPTNNTTTSLANRTATIILASSETVTCTFTNSFPTGIYLSMFKGVARDKDIKLKWRTANEFDVVGFNVWRRTGRDGTFVKMNTNLIPADSPGGKLGARYVFKDMTALAGTKYFYKLELSDGVNAVELSDIIRVRKPPSQ